MPASLLYADASKSRQTHYWILGCVAAVGTARGGGQMKDDCAAVGIRCRKKTERVCLSDCIFLFAFVSEFLHVSMWQ